MLQQLHGKWYVLYCSKGSDDVEVQMLNDIV